VLIGLSALNCAIGSINGQPTHYGFIYDAYRTHRARWDLAHPPGYEYNVRYKCFCSSALLRRTTVRVLGDSAISAIQDGDLVNQKAFKECPTIDALYDLIYRSMESSYDRVFVRYDRRWHYPVEIFIDMKASVDDDELEVFADSFAPVE